MNVTGDRSKPGHQGERLQIVIPKLSRTAKATQLHHGEEEVEAVGFRLLRDRAIEVKGGHVLRRVRGHHPAVVADGDENA